MSLYAIEEPATLDITVVVGNSFNREVQLCDDDGVAIPLSGMAACAQIIDEEEDKLLVEFIVSSLDDDGKIPLLLKTEDTQKLAGCSSARWSLTVFDEANPATYTVTVICGRVTIKDVGLDLKGALA
jgi:hypothetical protein